MIYDTKRRGHAIYERRTEWRRDKTIPWDLAWVTGTLVEPISENMPVGHVIYSGHMTQQAWLGLEHP